ncbi:MAG: alpha/beta fold hydrolase [Ilumatobacteraceae bacterium]
MSLTTYRIEREGASRLLVLLHGWTAEQHHLAAYVPLVDPAERFTAVCPRAPHPVEGTDGASWYERGPGGPEPTSFNAAVETIDELISRECAAAGIGREQCVVGGFSQGGFLALALAGRAGAPRVAGVWAMCCGLPEVDGVDLDLGAGAGTPALIQLGERDPIMPPERGRAAADALATAEWTVTQRGYDMAHSQTIEMMVDARAWLAELP